MSYNFPNSKILKTVSGIKCLLSKKTKIPNLSRIGHQIRYENEFFKSLEEYSKSKKAIKIGEKKKLKAFEGLLRYHPMQLHTKFGKVRSITLPCIKIISWTLDRQQMTDTNF